MREFDKPFCVGLIHMNPCGAATGKDVVEAWTKAYEADKVSIFGGIVATNRTVTKEAAELMKPIFLEIIMAPKFDEGALEVLSAKKNLRLLEVSMDKGDVDPKQYVSVNGGLLVQDLDVATKAVTADMCVTKAKPAPEQMEDLNFGWHIVKHVKSNAIVAVKDGRSLCVGAGQMNRIGSAEIALKQAHATGVTEGLVLAAKSYAALRDLNAIIRDDMMKKEYLTITVGAPPQGRFVAWLQHSEKNNKVRIHARESEGYKQIITEVTVIRQAGPFALCRIGLITGRTHQIRAHLAYLGHPVLGDIKYGNHKMNERTGLKTQALCAQRLTFGRIPEENTLQYLSGRVIKLNDPEIVKTYERLTAEK